MKELGEELQSRRLELGLSLQEVAEATKIREAYLHALETGKRNELPADVYTKGFLRTYANYLGLDGDRFVQRYNQNAGTKADDPLDMVITRRRSLHESRQTHAIAAPPIAQSGRRRMRRQRRKRQSSFPRVAGVLVSVAVLLYLVYTVGSHLSTRPASQPNLPGVESPGLETTVPDPVEEVGEEIVEEEQLPSIELETIAQERDSHTVLVHHAEQLEMHLSASADCWIGAYVDGELAWEKTLSSGNEELLSASENIYLVIGYPPALKIQINGQELPRLDTTVVYKLTVERRS